jgi:hypothetical protein
MPTCAGLAALALLVFERPLKKEERARLPATESE